MMKIAKPWQLPWYLAACSPFYSLQFRHYVISLVLNVTSVHLFSLQMTIVLPVLELAILRLADNASTLVNSTLEALPQVSKTRSDLKEPLLQAVPWPVTHTRNS